jgi:hypothetical protein
MFKNFFYNISIILKRCIFKIEKNSKIYIYWVFNFYKNKKDEKIIIQIFIKILKN